MKTFRGMLLALALAGGAGLAAQAQDDPGCDASCQAARKAANPLADVHALITDNTIAYNTGTDHRKANLAQDGTCRYCHKCSNWVDNKGPKGQCLGNHPATACTNANKCDQPKQ